MVGVSSLELLNALFLWNINNNQSYHSQSQLLTKMEQIKQNQFLNFPLSTQTISCSGLPFYVVYLNNNVIPNIDYSNFFHFNPINNDINQNAGCTYQETFQKFEKNVQIIEASSMQSPKINASQIYQQASRFNNSCPSTKIKSIAKTVIRESQDEEYSPKESSQFQLRIYKLSQTKNIPKNYQKAILLFIGKNIAYTYRVLQHCNVDFEDFMKFYRQMKTGLGSMAKLRSLWIDSQNRYAKVFRIISKEYLRKHSLGYIFNSRVVNISKHIKYRQIIQGSIGNPQSFTHMKEY